MAVTKQTKQNLNTLKRREIIQSMASDYSEMILEITSREKLGKLRNMWKLNRILLNNQWVKGEIKKEIRKSLGWMQMNTQCIEMQNSVKALLKGDGVEGMLTC